MSKAPSWSTRTVTLIVLSCCAVGVEACSPNAPKENEPTPVLSGPPNTAFPMPPINTNKSLGQMGWALPEGNRITVSSYKDKVLVLDFYATWCMPCRDSIPHLIDLQNRYGPQGLAIVGLNVGGPDDREAVPAFAREFKIQYALGFPDQELGDLLLSDSDAIPQTFVFDRRGQLVQRYVGYGDSTAGELEQAIKGALTSPSK